MTTPLSQPASGTPGLVVIEALGPAGEYRDTQPRGDHTTAGVAVAELSIGRAPGASR
jgi:hypothetical protein